MKRMAAALVLASAMPAAPAAHAEGTTSDADLRLTFTEIRHEMFADEAAADWAVLVAEEDPDAPLPGPPPEPGDGTDAHAVLADWVGGYVRMVRQAYAHAALGHIEYARYLVTNARDNLAVSEGGEGNASKTLTELVRTDLVDTVAAHIEARIAFEEDRVEDARRLASASKLDGPTGADLAAAVGLPLPAKADVLRPAMQAPIILGAAEGRMPSAPLALDSLPLAGFAFTNFLATPGSDVAVPSSPYRVAAAGNFDTYGKVPPPNIRWMIEDGTESFSGSAFATQSGTLATSNAKSSVTL
ncbi:hypothetical protein E3U23_08205 [Erythrobacter litoralis]|uniref:hypothetical protein n=1 Tax=Erythrobacter litoralis TaxID=39960 RepID=UPI002434B5F4|nr:hypothetical protein [Erythrobacter litoralis]MDG6079174.1 hypothetical protein [Erythrobacter litoralis]